MTVKWFPQAHLAKLRMALAPAAGDYLSLARARFPSTTVAQSLGLQVAGNAANITSNDPRVGFFEEGVGPHIIEPKEGTILRLADGRFVSGSVQHPGMAAQPTLKPLLPLFPTLYRRRASALIR
jgi:hypothetical protein